MKAELLDAWIADLRSNPPQIKHQLHTIEGSCCLGRLCIVAEVPMTYHEKNRSWHFTTPNGGKEDCALSSGLGNQLGLSQEQEGYLIGMNDAGESFADIADYIEANREVIIATNEYFEFNPDLIMSPPPNRE